MILHDEIRAALEAADIQHAVHFREHMKTTRTDEGMKAAQIAAMKAAIVAFFKHIPEYYVQKMNTMPGLKK